MIRSFMFLIISCYAIPLHLSANTEDKMALRIQKEVLAKDAKASLASLKQLQRELQILRDQPSLKQVETARRTFRTLVKHWKAVECLYIAGYLSDDLVDSPRYIDVFHRGNEDIVAQLDRILLNSKPLKTQLFKSSLKTINAMEYLLFRDPSDKVYLSKISKDKRILDMMTYVAGHLETHLQDIESFYRTSKSLQSNGEKTIQYIVNSLIDSSYKLKNWRIEDAAGLKGDSERSAWEYPYSQLSIMAIASILDTYERLLGLDGQISFISLSKSPKSTQVIKDIKVRVHAARVYADQLVMSSKPTNKQDIKKLLTLVTPIHDLFYSALIKSLRLSDHILDADGD